MCGSGFGSVSSKGGKESEEDVSVVTSVIAAVAAVAAALAVLVGKESGCGNNSAVVLPFSMLGLLTFPDDGTSDLLLWGEAF